MKLIHWRLMGGMLHLVQRGGDCNCDRNWLGAYEEVSESPQCQKRHSYQVNPRVSPYSRLPHQWCRKLHSPRRFPSSDLTGRQIGAVASGQTQLKTIWPAQILYAQSAWKRRKCLIWACNSLAHLSPDLLSSVQANRRIAVLWSVAVRF